MSAGVELLLQPRHHEVDDGLDLLALQLVEHDDLVDAIEELGPEDALELARDARLHVLVAQTPDRRLGEAQRRLPRDVLGADVAGHDQHGVAEVDRAALGIGETTVLEDLEEDVEHVRVRLLDLVEEDHAVGLAAHDLGELAALLVTHVAGRRADQARDGVLLHVLAHVDLHEMILVAEEERRQRARQLRLADTRRTQEDERAGGAPGVLEPGAAPADGLADGAYRLLLPDQP